MSFSIQKLPNILLSVLICYWSLVLYLGVFEFLDIEGTHFVNDIFGKSVEEGLGFKEKGSDFLCLENVEVIISFVTVFTNNTHNSILKADNIKLLLIIIIFSYFPS